MANSRQALKRARQNIARGRHNSAMRSMVRTAVKRVLKGLKAQDAAGARAIFVQAQASLDKVAAKGIIHKNTAARIKSRISKKIKAMSHTP